MNKKLLKFLSVLLVVGLGFVIFVLMVEAQEQRLSDEAKEILKNVRVICVIVDESYGKADKVRLPFLEYSKRILRYGGLTVVGRDEKTYDATLQVWTEGEAISADFGAFRRRYSGAEINGKLSMKIGKNTLYSLPFSFTYGPDYVIPSIAYVTPNDASFKKAFNYGFLPALFKMFAHIKGLETVIAALKDEDSTVRGGAARSLGEIKDSRAIKPLIAVVLKDEDSGVRSGASIALSKITGENFGDPSKWPHPSEWQEWWEKNKAK